MNQRSVNFKGGSDRFPRSRLHDRPGVRRPIRTSQRWFEADAGATPVRGIGAYLPHVDSSGQERRGLERSCVSNRVLSRRRRTVEFHLLHRLPCLLSTVGEAADAEAMARADLPAPAGRPTRLLLRGIGSSPTRLVTYTARCRSNITRMVFGSAAVEG